MGGWQEDLCPWCFLSPVSEGACRTGPCPGPVPVPVFPPTSVGENLGQNREIPPIFSDGKNWVRNSVPLPPSLTCRVGEEEEGSMEELHGEGSSKGVGRGSAQWS